MILFLFWGDREFEALLLGRGVSVTGEPRRPPRLLVGALASSSNHAAQDLDRAGLRRQKDAAAQAWRARGFRGRSRLRDDDAVLRRARPRCGGARRLPNLLAITVPI